MSTGTQRVNLGVGAAVSRNDVRFIVRINATESFPGR
jgi:hypothetical protein